MQRALMLVPAVLLVVGCHDGESDEADRGSVPRVWVQEAATTNGGMAAEVRGTLRYDAARDCFLIELEDVRYPVVWPARTLGTGDGPGVVLDDDSIARVGDQVAGGGGYLQIADEYDIPDQCLPSSGEVAVFNPNETLRINGS